jgi:peroxiredoxin
MCRFLLSYAAYTVAVLSSTWALIDVVAAEPSEIFVPRNLLKLVHASEVQTELGINNENEDQFSKLLMGIDRKWWPSRTQTEAVQLKLVAELESQLLSKLSAMLPPDRLQRLREIEIQSLGTRALAKPDIAKAIGLTSNQIQELHSVFAEVDGLAKKSLESKGKDSEAEKKLTAAREEEFKRIKSILTPLQTKSLSGLIGRPFETAKLKRIYPLAPELIDSGEWANSAATTLAANRGRIVLLHFYAFQCHNCVANFQHYTRWHESLAARGVRVIGIQTPETSAERDPQKVRQAAKERGFEFPVLIDLESKNWAAWGNTMWPTVYVIDPKGYIRFWWQGELNWQGATGDKTIEKLIDELLAEKK